MELANHHPGCALPSRDGQRRQSRGWEQLRGLQTCSGWAALAPAEGSGERIAAEGWEQRARAGCREGNTGEAPVPACSAHTSPAHRALSLLPTLKSSLGFNSVLEQEEDSAGPQHDMEMAQAEQRRA